MSLMIKKASELQVKDGNDEWLVKDLLPKNSLILLGAAPKQGKTMLALELCTSICTGYDAFGQYNVPMRGRVLYYAGEDSESILKKRIAGFSSYKTQSPFDLELYTITDQVMLLDTEEGRADLCQSIEEMKPDLVVIDNLSRIHNGNENNAKFIGEMFEFFQSVKRKYNVTVIIVCHIGKDGNGIRGSSQIDSYYEAAIYLRSKDGQRFMDLKFRGYEERLDIPYRIESEGESLKFVIGELNVSEHDTSKGIEPKYKQVASGAWERIA